MPNTRRPKFPPSDPPPAAAALDDACSSACDGCPECSLEHDEYAPALLVLRFPRSVRADQVAA